MSIKKISVLFCALFIIVSVPLTSHAKTESSPRNVSVKVDYPYFRGAEKKSFSAIDDVTYPWPNKETRVGEKVGRSAFFNFLIEHTVPNIPPVNALFASQKSSKEEETLSSPRFVDTYHVTGCTTNHTYKVYNNPLNFTRDVEEKIDAKIRTVCRSPRGYKGSDTGFQTVYDSPYIPERQTRGEGTFRYNTTDAIVTHSIKQESRAVLTLVTPPENLCVTYGRYLVNACAKGAVSNLIPGGFIVSQSGAVTKVTGKLEDLIFRNNPLWSVPIKVSAAALTPRLDSDRVLVFDERPIPCTSIEVLGKKLGANCMVKVSIREKEMLKDITPSVDSVKYYRYDIEITGTPVQGSTSIIASVLNSLVAAVYPIEEGTVTLDNEGFMIVPSDNTAFLPLSSYVDPFKPEIVSTTPTINSVTPSSFKVWDPITITLTGTNFEGVIAELITISNDTGFLNPTLISATPTEIRISIPPVPIGTYNINLSANKGDSNTKSFTITSATGGSKDK